MKEIEPHRTLLPETATLREEVYSRLRIEDTQMSTYLGAAVHSKEFSFISSSAFSHSIPRPSAGRRGNPWNSIALDLISGDGCFKRQNRRKVRQHIDAGNAHASARVFWLSQAFPG